jgi:hypothetical protein
MEDFCCIAGMGPMRLRNYSTSGGNEKTCGRVSGGFQMELGFVSTGIGLVGFLSFWKEGYWLPFIIIMEYIFVWGAGYTPILCMMQHNNIAPSNAGVVHWDFLQNYFEMRSNEIHIISFNGSFEGKTLSKGTSLIY